MSTASVAILMGATSPPAGLLGDGIVFLGDDFLPWIVLALGAAMVAGNALALVRPPTPAAGGTGPEDDEPPPRPPLRRALVMIVIGAVAAIWGIASLVA